MQHSPIIVKLQMLMVGLQPCYRWTVLLFPWCLQSTLQVVRIRLCWEWETIQATRVPLQLKQISHFLMENARKSFTCLSSLMPTIRTRWVWMWLISIEPILIHSSYPDAISIHFAIGFGRQLLLTALSSIQIFQQKTGTLWCSLTSVFLFYMTLCKLKVHQQWKFPPMLWLHKQSLSWLLPFNLPCPHCLPG